jgi:hypothetical protein
MSSFYMVNPFAITDFSGAVLLKVYANGDDGDDDDQARGGGGDDDEGGNDEGNDDRSSSSFNLNDDNRVFDLLQDDNNDKGMLDQAKALAFIKSMYNPNVGMLREAPGFDRYWLWSDQLLGQLILKAVDPALAAKIETKMLSYKIPMKNLWVTLDPKYRENFSAGGTKEIKVSGTSNIWYSDYGGSNIPCTSHADVAFLTAIHLHYSGDKNGALSCYNAGKSMWDGRGMKDRGQITGDYAVYKVALGLLAQKILNAPPIGIPGNYFDKFQASNGGITTDLTGGVPKGSQNIETTFAVLVALNPSLLAGVAAGDLGCSENAKNTVKNMEDKKPELVLPLGDLSYQSTANC